MSKENFKKEKTKYIALVLSNIKTPVFSSKTPEEDFFSAHEGLNVARSTTNYTYLENCIKYTKQIFSCIAEQIQSNCKDMIPEKRETNDVNSKIFPAYHLKAVPRLLHREGDSNRAQKSC